MLKIIFHSINKSFQIFLTKTTNLQSVGFIHEGKSTASFCRQVAVRVPTMFCKFYLVKNHNIANNSATTENKRIFGILRLLEIF
jgi:hypothetical protein